MQSEIETFPFHFVGDAQADDRIEHFEKDQRDDGIVDDYDRDAFDLIDHLGSIALDQAGGAAVFTDGEHAGEQRADDTADTMHTEAVERIILVEDPLEASDAPVADDAGSNADR